MPKPEKIALVDNIAGKLENAASVVLCDFKGINVEEISELRKRCREAGVTFQVIKNTMLIRAAEKYDHRKGFRFIEVIAPCSTLYSRLNRLGSGLDLIKFYHDNSEIRHGADTREVDIGFQDRFICGNFVDEDRPTFLDMMHAHYEEILGDRFVPMPDEGGWLHD